MVDFAENARSVSTPLFLFSLVVWNWNAVLAERAEVSQAFFSSSKFSSRLHSITGYFHANDPGKPQPGFPSFRFRDSNLEPSVSLRLPVAKLQNATVT
jgi:hypothetical protein